MERLFRKNMSYPPQQTFINRETGIEPEIAEGVYINGLVDCIGKIKIEKDVFFGHDVMLLTGGHDYNKFGEERKRSTKKGSIHIKEGAWIATRAILIGRPQGLVIGKHAVVGAGSIILNDVPDYTVVAGNPAKIIKIIEHE